MSKTCLFILLLVALVCVAGCKTSSGSREFTPGQGWKTND